MPGALSKVATKFAQYTECTYYTPPYNNLKSDYMLLGGYSADAARQTALYDRVGHTSPDTSMQEGDVVRIEGNEYIIGAKIPEIVTELYGYTLYLVHVFCESTITRTVAVNNVTTSFPEASTTTLYTGIPIGFRRLEASIVKEMETVREENYVYIPVGCTVQVNDVLTVEGYGSYAIEVFTPYMTGVYFAKVSEERVE